MESSAHTRGPDLASLQAAALAEGGVLRIAGLAENNRALVRDLRSLDPQKAAATFGGLLTQPELQANCLRLEGLVHLAVRHAQGARKPNRDFVSRAFRVLGGGGLGILEDPSEDLFASLVPTDNPPAGTDLKTLAAAVRARWVCEQAHQQLKEELGLDHFEGRSWAGLHRHALMTMIAHAFLQHRRLSAAKRGKKAARTSTAAQPARGPRRRHRRAPAYALAAPMPALRQVDQRAA